MKEKQKPKNLESLFDQTKDLEFIGQRMTGNPEVLDEIHSWLRYPILSKQIQLILRYVPSVFPEDWKSPKGDDELSKKEKEAYKEIACIGDYMGKVIPCPVIQRVIELGVQYRNENSKRRKYSSNNSITSHNIKESIYLFQEEKLQQIIKGLWILYIALCMVNQKKNLIRDLKI